MVHIASCAVTYLDREGGQRREEVGRVRVIDHGVVAVHVGEPHAEVGQIGGVQRLAQAPGRAEPVQTVLWGTHGDASESACHTSQDCPERCVNAIRDTLIQCVPVSVDRTTASGHTSDMDVW